MNECMTQERHNEIVETATAKEKRRLFLASLRLPDGHTPSLDELVAAKWRQWQEGLTPEAREASDRVEALKVKLRELQVRINSAIDSAMMEQEKLKDQLRIAGDQLEPLAPKFRPFEVPAGYEGPNPNLNQFWKQQGNG